MPQSQRDPYRLLGIELTASPDEIRAAYRRRAAEHHPDRQPPEQRDQASEQMKDLNAARDLLLDPARRAQYDAHAHLEAQEAAWRAQRDAYAPSQPAEVPLRNRRRPHSFWYSGWFLLVFFMLLLAAPFFVTQSGVSGDLSSPLALLMGLVRCVGGMALLVFLLPATAYLLAFFAQSLRR
jgi:hypothetical protein